MANRGNDSPVMPNMRAPQSCGRSTQTQQAIRQPAVETASWNQNSSGRLLTGRSRGVTRALCGAPSGPACHHSVACGPRSTAANWLCRAKKPSMRAKLSSMSGSSIRSSAASARIGCPGAAMPSRRAPAGIAADWLRSTATPPSGPAASRSPSHGMCRASATASAMAARQYPSAADSQSEGGRCEEGVMLRVQ